MDRSIRPKIALMHDFNSLGFQSSLFQTVSWCKSHSFWAEADSEKVRECHTLYLRAEQLAKEAQRSTKASGTGRNVTKSKAWQDAMALFKQIRDSLGPMHRKLRSSELKPSFDIVDLRTNLQWSEAVGEVVAKRSRSISGGAVAKKNANAVGGRLLLYYPHENLACGAAEYSSNGFFDSNNVPPWDLWIEFSEETLVSWVPPMLVDLVQMGVESNPEECIRWVA